MRIFPIIPQPPAIPPTAAKLFPKTVQLVQTAFATYRENVCRAGLLGGITGLGFGIAVGMAIGFVLASRPK
jgi:ABC-type nitrate/sulfonate/bicarbonate transport system permease component